MTTKRILRVAVLLLLAASARALMQPQRINFQGKLINPSTNNPQAGPVNLTFNIYNVPTGGSSLYTETQNGVPLNNGVFSVQIGTVTGLSRELFLGASVYLGVTVVGDAGGEMLPRQNLVMSAYAFSASQLSDNADVRLIAGAVYSTFTSAGNFAVPAGVSGSSGSFTNGVTAASFTATNAAGAGFVTNSSMTASAFFGDASHLSNVTVTVNANLTGPVTSVGNATTIVGPVPQAAVNLSTVTTQFAAKASSGTNADLSSLLGAGSGLSISTQATHTSSVTMVNSTITLSGAYGTIIGVSSITAGAFFGDASHLSNVTATTNANLTGPVTSAGNATTIVGPVPQAAVNLSTVTTQFAAKASSGTNADLAAFNGAGASITISTSMTVISTASVLGSAFSVGGGSFAVGGGSATVAYGLTAGSLSASSATLSATGSGTGYGLTVSSGIVMLNGTLDVNGGGGITNSYGIQTATVAFLGSTTDPASAAAGTFYYNSSSSTLKMYNGANWRWMYAPTLQTAAWSASTAAATSARATGLIMVTPFVLTGPMVVNKMTVNVTTLLGATGDYGVYNSTGGLVLNVGSGLLTTAVGVKSLAPAQTGAGRFLPPGQYYAAVTWNNAAGVIGGSGLALGLVPLSGTATGGGSVLPATISLTSITNTNWLYFVGLSQ